VGEVAIHLQHQLRIGRLQHAREPGEVGAADPLLARAVEDVEPRQLLGESIGDLARPVRRAVVDHEHAVARDVEDVAEGAHERLDVLPLVVGRHADHSPHRHARSLPSPTANGASL
jgi:hypothetical protein